MEARAAAAAAKEQTETEGGGSDARESAKKNRLEYSRRDVENMKDREWIDDGLGGRFNKEGYTGRTEGGVKIFKAHLFNQSDFGNTPDCPFDCKCCYI